MTTASPAVAAGSQGGWGGSQGSGAGGAAPDTSSMGSYNQSYGGGPARGYQAQSSRAAPYAQRGGGGGTFT